jgi:hypothetical protein
MEQRLIDATKLQGEMMDMIASGLYGLEDMIDAVIEQPTVDAVPVTRCAQCKYGSKCLMDMIQCKVYGRLHSADWFCADGERRSDGKQ